VRGLLKVFVWSTIGFAAVVAAGYASLPVIERSLSGCEETDHRTIPSPNGSLEAVVHEADCGATTPFNTQVSVATRLFGIETSRETLFVVHGQYDLPVRWIDDATLAIGVPAGERVYRRDAAFDGGRVVYEDGGVVPPSTRIGP
jgi:hypothetical protein